MQEHAALQEIQQAREEATATSAVVAPVLEPDERDLLLSPAPARAEESAGTDGELQPFFSTWQRVLLWTGTVLVTIVVLLWGKIGYVHHIPDLVRDNVPAYQHDAGYLVLKPWWFGPPVLDLNTYARDTERPDWELYKARLGDYAAIVDNPYILWKFAEDPLQ
ncbi:hypothetical protein EL26_21495 [Tumebacillus flagellatus]|uniref:Uncharacterized protein n=1 Tax=Tumebacillus flagellatus TaxID=1157490 RepID=A0A074LL83_9BACL|nr:hypothetical protein EL26_21495 [Tumebacillus flagellatus]